MPRPFCPRRVGFVPGVTYFKPAGTPLRELEEVVVALDEVEALRLADLQGMYQEQAAEKMKISRPTFSRIVESARKKVADALINGKALRMEGGCVKMKGEVEMPNRDGTGPGSGRQGMGRGPCGCGMRQGGGGGRRRGRRRGAPADTPSAEDSAKEAKTS